MSQIASRYFRAVSCWRSAPSATMQRSTSLSGRASPRACEPNRYTARNGVTRLKASIQSARLSRAPCKEDGRLLSCNFTARNCNSRLGHRQAKADNRSAKRKEKTLRLAVRRSAKWKRRLTSCSECPVRTCPHPRWLTLTLNCSHRMPRWAAPRWSLRPAASSPYRDAPSMWAASFAQRL